MPATDIPPLGWCCPRCGRTFREPVADCCGSAPLPVPDYYGQLGCVATADRAVIDTAFRRLALVRHPDRCREPHLSRECVRERFIALADAWQILRNPELRLAHDRVREALLRPGRDLAGTALPETAAIREASRRWAESSFSALEAGLSRLDDLLRGVTTVSGKLLRKAPWADQGLARRGRLAALGYGLFGFWFAGVGAVVFPLLVLRRLRRRPGHEEALLAALGVLQLLPLLAYLVIAERMPAEFHLLFWTVSAVQLAAFLLWRRRFRTIPHPPGTR